MHYDQCFKVAEIFLKKSLAIFQNLKKIDLDTAWVNNDLGLLYYDLGLLCFEQIKKSKALQKALKHAVEALEVRRLLLVEGDMRITETSELLQKIINGRHHDFA